MEGDYRGTGRHDRFKITVTNQFGEPQPDPIPHPMDLGGLMQDVDLTNGQWFSNVVELTAFRVIDQPGVYSVNCSFALDSGMGQQSLSNRVITTTFTLRILERTPERVARVLDALLADAQSEGGEALADTLRTMIRFGKDDAAPRLEQLITNSQIKLRVAAIEALPQIPNAAAMKLALASLRDSDPQVRSAAANALGAMQQPAGVDALLDALAKEASPVSEAIVRALGKSKSEIAFPVITNTLDNGEPEIQRAAIDALVNFGGSNAVTALQMRINTNFLSLRYEVVLAFAEKLHQPMQAEWLLPILSGREMNHEWLDSIRLLRMYGGEKAIPTLLSCLDFDAAWSDRNWWILETGVKPCPNAPPCDYEHDSNSNGTPEERRQNLQVLRSLKPLAGPIPMPVATPRRAVPILKTEPPIDFVPRFKAIHGDGAKIKSGFLVLDIHRDEEEENFVPTEPFKALYKTGTHIRKLLDASGEQAKELNLSPTQKDQIIAALKKFAVRLCDTQVSDQRTSNFYGLLVGQADYCPSASAFFGFAYEDYLEAPDGSLKEQAKAKLMDQVQIFVQNYHTGTIELVETAKSILTHEQFDKVSKY